MWDLSSLSLPEVCLTKHVLCNVLDEISAQLFNEWMSYYGLSVDAGLQVAERLELAPASEGWDAREKNRVVINEILNKEPRFAIVSGREDVSHTQQRLLEEATCIGLKIDLFDLQDFSIDCDKLVGPVEPTDIAQYEAVFFATPEPLAADSAPIDRFVYQIWKLFEAAGAVVIPPSKADWQSRDKPQAIALLTSNGVTTPRTLTTISISSALKFVQNCKLEAKSVVIKPIGKSGGWGVGRIPSDMPEDKVLDLLG